MALPRIVYTVSLSPSEMDLARLYARLRREHHRGPVEHVPWEELMGTVGEMGVAKAFNLLSHWIDQAAYKADYKTIQADVGRNVQVRTVDLPFHNLAVRRTDPREAPYVACLVTPSDPSNVLLLGWMWGQAVEDNGRWRSDWPRPAWAVPVNHPSLIKSMDEFPVEELYK